MEERGTLFASCYTRALYFSEPLMAMPISVPSLAFAAGLGVVAAIAIGRRLRTASRRRWAEDDMRLALKLASRGNRAFRRHCIPFIP